MENNSFQKNEIVDLLGIDEKYLSAEICRLLFLASQKLGLFATTASTIAVLFHRYANFKGFDKLLAEDRVIVCSAIIFLGTKVDENNRPLRDIINVVYALIQGQIETLRNHTYHKIKENVVSQEQIILRALAFDVKVTLPHPYILNYARSLHLTKQVVKTAFSILTDCFLSRDCALLPPPLLSCGILFIAIQMVEVPNETVYSNDEISLGVISSNWWQIFDISDEALHSSVEKILDFIQSYCKMVNRL